MFAELQLGNLKSSADIKEAIPKQSSIGAMGALVKAIKIFHLSISFRTAGKPLSLLIKGSLATSWLKGAASYD